MPRVKRILWLLVMALALAACPKDISDTSGVEQSKEVAEAHRREGALAERASYQLSEPIDEVQF